MFRSRLFRTHFAIAAISIFGCVLVGAWILSLVVQQMEASREKEHRQQRQPPLFFANFIEEMSPKDAVAGLQRLAHFQGQNDPIRFSLLDERGRLLYPEGGAAPEMSSLPQALHVPQDVEDPSRPRASFSLALPPPSAPAPYTVMRLHYEPARYLVMKFRPPNHRPPGGPYFFPLSFLVMILMVLVGIAVALIMIFRSLREHVEAADQVITELQGGNLKARFQITRSDEIGNAKERFNAMADEIERLVERLRSAESSRNHLLQELAHDLRTPVASLQSIHESVFAEAVMSPEITELADLAHKEVEYMGHLVEDLLLLARLSEPSYQPLRRPVDFMALLEEEADSISLRKGEGIELVKDFRSAEALLRGDDHLFRRLVRNALENAFSHARTRVEVRAACTTDSRFEVSIHDDGPGFDLEALSKFGERRGQRMIKKTQGGRLSLGLGSVIMKSVISLHRGELVAANGRQGGAVIEFSLPMQP